MRRRLLLALTVALLFLPQAAESSVPPPTPVPPHGSPSPFPTALHTEAPRPNGPDHLTAAAAILEDADTGQVLFALKPDFERPVASLTKVIAALLTIERSRPEAMVTVSANAAPPPGEVGIANLGLVAGEKISVEDLLYALLLQSANDSAVALAEQAGGSVDSFVRDMNRRAEQLGAEHTRFASPSGLNDHGYSTPRDLATIMRAAQIGRAHV